MFATQNVTVNYVLGFVIVLLILVAVLSYSTTHEKRMSKTTKNVTKTKQKPYYSVGVTLITDEGPLQTNHAMLEHYLTRLNSNIEYVIKRADTNKCNESIQQLQQAKDKLHSQITESVEHIRPTIITVPQEDGDQVQNRINKLSSVMFENNQNEDAPQSIEVMYEIIHDVELLMRIARVRKENSPDEQFTIDIKDVDRIISLIYQTACSTSVDHGQYEDPPNFSYGDETLDTPTVFTSTTDINDIDTDPKSLTFGTYVDRYKHQNIKAETDTFSTKRTTSIKTKKQGLINARKISLSTHTPQNQQSSKLADTHEPNSIRHTPSHEEKGISSSIRIKTAQEDFNLERPHRHKKIKNGLVDSYDHLEPA